MLWARSPRRWMICNAGAAGATTVEPVLDTVWFVSCASEVETSNGVDSEFASVDIMVTLVRVIRLITCLR